MGGGYLWRRYAIWRQKIGGMTLGSTAPALARRLGFDLAATRAQGFRTHQFDQQVDRVVGRCRFPEMLVGPSDQSLGLQPLTHISPQPLPPRD